LGKAKTNLLEKACGRVVTMKKFSEVLFCLFLVSTLMACSPASKNSKEGSADFGSPKKTFEGELNKEVRSIFSAENELMFDPCDFQNRQKIFEIAEALEKNRPAIEQYGKSLVAQEETSYTKIGPFQFANPAVETPAENKWSDETWSWAEIIKDYEAIKKEPVGKQWFSLNRYVRTIIPSDSYRLVDRGFLGMSRTSGPVMFAIKKTVDQCWATPLCVKPSLNAEQIKFLSHSGSFKLYFPVFDSKTMTHTQKRAQLKKFQETVAVHAQRFDLKLDPNARTEGKTLIIPLDLTAFKEGSRDAATEMEKAWNMDSEFNVKIEEIKKPQPGFIVQVGEEVGGRASVSRDRSVMKLYNLGKLTTMHHEFGHILGFEDNYHTLWDRKSCAYQLEFNSTDIMSDSTSGKVLSTHWEQLKKTYWKADSK
jgi:hypothetical protein